MAGWGLIEWTRLEAEKVTADQIGNRKRTEPPSLTKGGIRMKSASLDSHEQYCSLSEKFRYAAAARKDHLTTH